MPDSSNSTVDRDTLLDTIRAVAAHKPAGKHLTLLKFLAESGFGERAVFNHFPKWSEAVLAAGVKFKNPNSAVPTSELMADWAGVARELGRLPTHKEFKLRGKHDPSTFRSRFGAWSQVPEAFRGFAGSTQEWSDVAALLPPASKAAKASRRRKQRASRVRLIQGRRRHARLPSRPVCGAPIEFPGLRHAPANEGGVVFLFGAMAPKLGFLVDSFQNEFPDCEAKRLIAPDTWQNVRIEFEYESRNFREHGHDPAKCDLIVCWEHNWPECPKNIEVIALSDELKRIGKDN